MYKQFSSVSLLSVSEREHKLKYGSLSKKDSDDLYNNLFNNRKKKNWKVFIKRSKYFSFVPLLISDKTSLHYYKNTKCCIDYQIKKKNFEKQLK